jgi:hypothetical protein
MCSTSHFSISSDTVLLGVRVVIDSGSKTGAFILKDGEMVEQGTGRGGGVQGESSNLCSGSDAHPRRGRGRGGWRQLLAPIAFSVLYILPPKQHAQIPSTSNRRRRNAQRKRDLQFQ